jgi:hypothetical protein
MRANYIRLTADTMENLPSEKQVEVYDFAKFLKTSSKAIAVTKKTGKASVLDIIGIGASGAGDIALKHDTYLYE